jgi:hypothetical protein
MPFRDPQEIEELLTESVTKELKAAQEEHSVESLDWQAILSQNRIYRSNNSLISNTTFDGELNNRMFSRLSSAKSKISCMTIYPDYSRKTIGRRGFERIYDAEWDYCENIRMNGSRALKLTRDLGYAQIEPVFYTFIVGSNPEYLETFIAREHRFPVVEVSFVKHTPSFLVELMFPPCPSQVTDYDTSLLSSDSEEDV